MSRATKIEADLMRNIQADSQFSGHNEPLLVELCRRKGWIQRDFHGCLYLTFNGERALEKYKASHG